MFKKFIVYIIIIPFINRQPVQYFINEGQYFSFTKKEQPVWRSFIDI